MVSLMWFNVLRDPISNGFQCVRMRLPMSLCAPVADVLSGSHNTLDAIFLTAGGAWATAEHGPPYEVEDMVLDGEQGPFGRYSRVDRRLDRGVHGFATPDIKRAEEAIRCYRRFACILPAKTGTASRRT
jgi:hypothetical protein